MGPISVPISPNFTPSQTVSTWQRLKAFPAQMSRLHAVVRDAYSPAALDGKLCALHAFHQGVPVKDVPANAFNRLMPYEPSTWTTFATTAVIAAHRKAGSDLDMNILENESMHLALTSGLRTYLFGGTPLRRFGDVLLDGFNFFADQVYRLNPLDLAELTTALLMSRYYTERWLSTVPLQTLRAVFDSRPLLPPAQNGGTDKLASNTEKPVDFTFWPKALREEALSQEEFAKSHAEMIEEIIDVLDGFQGAEISGSKEDIEMKDDIAGQILLWGEFPGRSPEAIEYRMRLRDAIEARLRDYQIRHNRDVTSGKMAPEEAPGRALN